MKTLIYAGANDKTVNGVSYKIYQAQVLGRSVVVSYGPIEIQGRKTIRGWAKEQIKSYESTSQAEAALEKLIASKLAKGYRYATPAQIP